MGGPILWPGLHLAWRYQLGERLGGEPSAGPPSSHGLLPVTAGASLLCTRLGCRYCIPSLSGTVQICVWPGWGEGTLNKQPMAPVSAKAQPRLTVTPSLGREAFPWTLGPGASRIHVAKKKKKKKVGALPPTPQPSQIALGAPPAFPPPWAFHPLIH